MTSILVPPAGEVPWDRNDVVTVISTEKDGDKVLARDAKGQQQSIPIGPTSTCYLLR